MPATHTVVTIDATALGEHLEHLADTFEAKAADDRNSDVSRSHWQGAAVSHRQMLRTLTEQIELGADGFLVVDHA